MTYEVYINEQLIEISNPKLIGLNYQVGSIFLIDSRSGNLSNQFKVPKTQRNNIVLGNLSNINSVNNLPYEQIKAKIVQNGIEIVPNGFALIESTDDNYNITIYSGNTSFFDLIKNKNINELDLSDCEHDYNITDILASYTSDKYVYPVVDFGKDSIFLLDGVQEATAFTPCLFIGDVMNRSANEVGYSIKGDFKDSEAFDELIITPNNWGLTASQVNELSGVATFTTPNSTPTTTTITAGSGTVEITIPYTFTNIDNPLFTGQDYDPNEEFSGRLNSWTHFFVLNTGIPQPAIKVIIKKNGVALVGDTSFRGMSLASWGYGLLWGEGIDQFFDPTATYSCEFIIRFTRTGVNYDVDYYISRASFNVAAYKYIPYGYPVNMADLYNKKLTDLWRDIISMYCLIIQTNDVTKEVSLNYLDSILNNISISENWSNKLDPTKEPKVSYQIPNYAQRNVFTNNPDDDVKVVDITGTINVSNTNLELEKTLVQTTNAYVENGLRNGNQSTPLVPLKLDYLDSFANKKNRYLRLDKKTDFISIQNVTTSEYEEVEDNIPYCYFKEDGNANSLDFPSLISANYRAVQSMLVQAKVVDAYFRLTEIDIVNLDFTKPVYLDINTGTTSINGYFYINKVSNFKIDSSTLVELIRL